ncbi:uncharacterized protein BXZ73DRAFT_79681 [Epithele typhae]|uniref:uncharacterized protein n=1 Tax=Epithele typhae TaxID=378194 RepID=UPI002007AA8C|nr:uncharacterized protein BXZ73DRAFT_79681 [Epithele typhae]KAH9922873.1 hypothetical protein BXZ73DRAFT_79681 [Epithele typhae]
MRHPFAMVQSPRPASSFSILPLSPTEEPEPGPSQSIPNPRSITFNDRAHAPSENTSALPSILPLRKDNNMAPRGPSRQRSWTASRAPLGTLSSTQREGTRMPRYSNADTIEGVLAVARSSGVLALQVKVQGAIHIEEIAGSGSTDIRIVDDVIYSWDAQQGVFPPKASFRHYPLPPTFSEELCGIPGFTVDVSYAIVVNLTLCGALRRFGGRSAGVPPIKVQICPHHEPMPFRVTLSAEPETTLDSFAEYRPLPASFLPLSPSPSNSSSESARPHISARRAPPHCPIRIRVIRTTVVDAGRAASPFLPNARPPRATTSLRAWAWARHVQLRQRVDRAQQESDSKPQQERAQVPGPGRGGEAVRRPELHVCHASDRAGRRAQRDARRTARARAAVVGRDCAPAARGCAEWDAFSGAFEVSGLKVVDSIVLQIDPPSGCAVEYEPLNEAIPVRLTSDGMTSKKAVPISSVG